MMCLEFHFVREPGSICLSTCFLLPADRADERRKPISENLRNLREVFLLPVRKASGNAQKACRAGTRPAGLRQISLTKSDV
jgi:hypothetical protein